MKNVRRLLMLAALSVLVIAACETPPEPVEEADPEDIPATEQEQARNLRSTIMEYELDQYAVAEFAEAEQYFEEAEALLDEDVDAATESYIAAIALYEEVVRIGFTELIGGLKAEIAEVRADAEGIRADVAARTEFEQGAESYDEGEALEVQGDWERAYQMFEGSLNSFTASYDVAREKRDRADEAMARAQEKEDDTERQVREMEDELEDELEEDDD